MGVAEGDFGGKCDVFCAILMPAEGYSYERVVESTRESHGLA